MYEPSSTTEPPKLPGDDTITKITIMDEDQPGTLCFEETQLDVSRSADEIAIKVCRIDGADGAISVNIRTEACESTTGLGQEGSPIEKAEEGIHYEHMS